MRSWHHLRQADFGDQLIVIWPACFSPNPKDGLMTIGPQLGEPKIEHDQDVIRFLDRQAPKSVVYISFGSYSWIPSLQQSILLFDTIRKLGLGVLVVNALNPILGAPRTDILEVVNDRLGKTQGRGLLVDWAPQNEVLLHPVSHPVFWFASLMR
jgi:hypothetical protein